MYSKYYYQQVKVAIFRFLPFVFMKKYFLCDELCRTMLKSVVYTVIPGYVEIRYTSSVLDCGFEPCSGQIKEYKIGICCFSTKQVGSESE